MVDSFDDSGMDTVVDPDRANMGLIINNMDSSNQNSADATISDFRNGPHSQP